MYTLPQKIEAAGINASFTFKVLFKIFTERKDLERRAKWLYTVLISCYLKSARYQIPQKNGPYSTQIILETLYLPKMSITQSSNFTKHVVNYENSFIPSVYFIEK